MYHCWSRTTYRQQNLKTSIQMFSNLFFVTPLWEDAYAIQGRTPFPYFKWLNLDNSLHKENGTLLMKSPTNFLTWTNTQWSPLFLKEGGMIQPTVDRFALTGPPRHVRSIGSPLTCLPLHVHFDKSTSTGLPRHTTYQHALLGTVELLNRYNFFCNWT